MNRIIRNLVLILFGAVLTFTLLQTTFSWTASGYFLEGGEKYFVPTRDNFVGFEVFFSKIETYPGLQNLLGTIEDISKTFSNVDDGLEGIVAVISLLFVPLKTAIAVIIDVVNNIIWLISLLDPYHNFVGF